MLHQNRPFEREARLLETGSGSRMARTSMASARKSMGSVVVCPSKSMPTKRNTFVEKSSGGCGGEHSCGRQLAQWIMLDCLLAGAIAADVGAVKVQAEAEAAWPTLADRSGSLVHVSTKT